MADEQRLGSSLQSHTASSQASSTTRRDANDEGVPAPANAASPVDKEAADTSALAPERHVNLVKLPYLIRKPIVRQFLHDGHFHEAQASKDPSRFELFFDLIVVAMLRQMSKKVGEEFTAHRLALFIVLFWPIWTIWNDVRFFVNVSGVDDVAQRIYILLIMTLLLGYSVNAASLRLPNETLYESLEQAPGANPNEFEGGVDPFATLTATIAFVVIAKAVRFGQLVVYAIWLSRFRASFVHSALNTFLSIAIYFPLLFVKNVAVFWTLMVLGLAQDLFLQLITNAITRFEERKASRVAKEEKQFRPALNIPHHLERNAQFIVIVLGESLLKITYEAEGHSIGVSMYYARAVMALVCAFCLCNLSFDTDACHTYIHALRRHWLSAALFSFSMFPLSSGIILWSSSLIDVVAYDEVRGGAQWFFVGSLSATLVCLAFMGLLHRNMDVAGSPVLPRWFRLSLRLCLAVIFPLLPLAESMRVTINLMGVAACLLVVLVGAEIIGKIGARSQDFEDAPCGVRLGDLTDAERGEEDVGIEAGLTEVEKQAVPLKQRLAWTAP